MVQRIGVEKEEDVENLVESMCSEGELDAQVDQERGVVVFQRMGEGGSDDSSQLKTRINTLQQNLQEALSINSKVKDIHRMISKHPDYLQKSVLENDTGSPDPEEETKG